MPGNIVSTISKTTDPAAATAAFWSNWTHNSIFESLAVEQLGGISAVSTVKLVDIANDQGLRIYNATQANYAANVKPFLDASCDPYLPGFAGAINNAVSDVRLILPRRCDIGEQDWSGAGYFAITTTETNNGPRTSILSAINGRLAGGFPSSSQSASELSNNASNPINFPSLSESNAESGSTFGDPIDIFKGNYLFSHQDIHVGNGNFPNSLSFQRYYSSSNHNKASVLGNGWTHNFDVTVSTGVDGFQGMGEDSPIDAASSIIETMVSFDLMKDSSKPIDKVVTAVIGQRWFADQLLKNTVIIKNGQNAELFVQLPSGEYNAPPGSAAKLIKNNDNTFSYETLGKTQINFGSNGKVSEWVHPTGVKVQFTYDGNQLKKVKNSLGRELTLNYSNNQLTQISDGQGRTVSYRQNASNLTEFTDATGEKTTYEYDQPGRMTKIFYPTRPAQPFIHNQYDSLGRIQTQANANNQIWTYYFAGSRSEEQDPTGASKIRYQNRFGSPLRLIDEIGRETVNRYDGQNRLIQTTQAEGNSLSYVYDDSSCGGSINQCNHKVAAITATPKPASLLAAVTQTFSYHPTYAKVTRTTDARHATTNYTYDAQSGELLTVTQPADQNGNRPQQSIAYANFSSALGGGQFSLPGLITEKISVAESTVTTFDYDSTNAFVPKTITIDAGGLNLTSTSSYDTIGNLTQVNGPRTDVNDISSYSYDSERRLISTTDALGHTSRITYDVDGHPIRAASQTGNQWQVTCTDYTPTKQIQKVWGPSLTAAFDHCPGQNSPIAVQDYQYDTVDRLSTVTAQLPASEGGARITKTDYYADGKPQRIIRDFGGALQQNNSSYSYTPNGQAATITDAQGQLTRNQYDGFDRLASTHYPHPTQTGQSSLTDRDEFSYDTNGNLTTWQQRSGEAIHYLYDPLNRLVEKQLPEATGNVSYTYDLLDRLTAQTRPDSAQSIGYDYDPANRLVAVTQGARTVAYQYDPSGNRTRMRWPDGFFIDYTYDAVSRLQSINQQASSTLANYQYDDLNLRKQLTLGNNTTTNYRYTHELRLQELSHHYTNADRNISLTHTVITK